jgi:O-antigen ligase
MNKYVFLTFSNINIFLISILPIGLLAGSFISNLIILIICLIFIIEIIRKKEFFFIHDINFYFLIIINLYLFLNSYFISYNSESIFKSIGFLRFIFLAYAISYYYNLAGDKILKIWAFFFLIVSFDILFEYFFGKNIIGNSSDYHGRIASFTGDELKIGGFYFGFIFLSLSYFYKRQKIFILLSISFLIIALLIGERSNFIKIFIMYLIFFIFFFKISYLKKMIIILTLTVIPISIILGNSKLQSKFINQIFDRKFIEIIKSDKEEIDLKKIISNNRYLSHYYVANNIFEKNIIFGSGFKTFRSESYKPEYNKDEINGASTHPHQLHFEILSELGLLGYFLIILNLLFIVLKNLQYNYKIVNIAALLFVLSSMIPILPSGSFFTSYSSTIFFINYSFLIRRRI